MQHIPMPLTLDPYGPSPAGLRPVEATTTLRHEDVANIRGQVSGIARRLGDEEVSAENLHRLVVRLGADILYFVGRTTLVQVPVQSLQEQAAKECLFRSLNIKEAEVRGDVDWRRQSPDSALEGHWLTVLRMSGSDLDRVIGCYSAADPRSRQEFAAGLTHTVEYGLRLRGIGEPVPGGSGVRTLPADGQGADSPGRTGEEGTPSAEDVDGQVSEQEPPHAPRAPSSDRQRDILTVITHSGTPLTRSEIQAAMRMKTEGALGRHLAWMVEHRILQSIPLRGYWPTELPLPE